MSKLTDHTSYADAQRHFSTSGLWDLFDGNRDRLNIAHECVDRYAEPGRIALRIAHADGQDETISFAELSAWSSRFAHWLTAAGRQARRSCRHHAGTRRWRSMPRLFGAMKRGAIAVPLFTLFGADGVRLRTQDCTPALLLTTPEKAAALAALDGPRIVAADQAFLTALTRIPGPVRPANRVHPIWRFSSTPPAPRGRCRRPSSTPTAPSWW